MTRDMRDIRFDYAIESDQRIVLENKKRLNALLDTGVLSRECEGNYYIRDKKSGLWKGPVLEEDNLYFTNRVFAETYARVFFSGNENITIENNILSSEKQYTPHKKLSRFGNVSTYD